MAQIVVGGKLFLPFIFWCGEKKAISCVAKRRKKCDKVNTFANSNLSYLCVLCVTRGNSQPPPPPPQFIFTAFYLFFFLLSLVRKTNCGIMDEEMKFVFGFLF
jgi:hypothetical protein